MHRVIFKSVMLVVFSGILLAFLQGCATYEREEYYESGQLKSHERASGITVKTK